MTYDQYLQYREAMLDAYYFGQLTGFASTFDLNKKTVILLPGGMGSHLKRTDQPFPAPNNIFDYNLWVSMDTLSSGNAPYLQIDQNLADGQQFVVGAQGPISILGLSPYDQFISQGKRKWNLFVLGFDFRRSIEESAKFFMKFITDFKAAIYNEYGYDPLPDVTVVAHSMGGLVLAYALHDAQFAQLQLNGYMTIATNFYGWPGQLKKYYLGQEPFNWSWTPDVVTRTVGSMPGGYSLMPMPTKIFDTYGAQIGLTKYPVQDKTTGAPTDPYDRACASRWPPWVMQNYLQQNMATLTTITNPFARTVASRFVNVRSIRNSTAVGLLWENVNGATYTAGSGKPIIEVMGKGDGVIPWWSAFHMGTPPNNRRSLSQAKDHVFLLEHDEVFDLVDHFVMTGSLPRPVAPRRRAPLKIADRVATKKAVLSALKARGAGRKIRGKLLAPEYRRGVLQLIMS